MSFLAAIPVAPNLIVRWGPDGHPADTKLARTIRKENGRTEARRCSDDELNRRLEVYQYLVADDSGTDDDRALRAVMYRPILEAIEAEIAHRARLRCTGKAPARSTSVRFEALKLLIGKVKTRLDIVAFLEWETLWQIIRGKTESHAACPICGTGRDRLVLFNDPPGRFFCRRCEVSGDGIELAGIVWGIDTSTADGLRTCVIRLAELCGLGQEAP
jgi:hypothetical protein